jgi:hypothetical protein
MISPLLSSIAAVAMELLLACLLLQFFANFGFFSEYFSQHVFLIYPFFVAVVADLILTRVLLLWLASVVGILPPLSLYSLLTI